MLRHVIINTNSQKSDADILILLLLTALKPAADECASVLSSLIPDEYLHADF